jgi:GNAT superfamily N-acetyltransferase
MELGAQNGPAGFHGSDGDIWVAERNDGSLVGYYCRIRYLMRCFRRTIVASQGLNLVTDSRFREQGIATELLSSSLRDAKKNGISMTFGFPIRLSYPLAIKQGAAGMGEASFKSRTPQGERVKVSAKQNHWFC